MRIERESKIRSLIVKTAFENLRHLVSDDGGGGTSPGLNLRAPNVCESVRVCGRGVICQDYVVKYGARKG